MDGKKVKDISKKRLTPAMEDYLEAIYNLSREKKVVRVKDIAKKLGVKMPTVTSMLKALSEKGMIDYEKYEYLELTGKGSDYGSEIDQRHRILKSFLINILQIDDNQADVDACKMEHAISSSTLERISDFMGFVQNCPHAENDWFVRFNQYSKGGKQKDRCLRRTKKFTHEFDVNSKERK
jgi:DtxR family Mn-dependent transcriptional regulator